MRRRHRRLKAGQSCPSSRCRGQVYPVVRPRRFTQYTGQPAITITIYEQEVLRCNDCGKGYEAPLPEGVSPKRYDETADAAIAINKYGLGTPYDRSAGLQQACGMPLAESMMSERCEAVAESLELPIQMSDALAANWSGERERIQAVCLAHARRKFWEIRSLYPIECGYVLERIGKVYQNEEASKGMSIDGNDRRKGDHKSRAIAESRGCGAGVIHAVNGRLPKGHRRSRMAGSVRAVEKRAAARENRSF